MPSIVSVHSFRGGTGKSNLSANIATVLASGGRRVGIVDADIQSPGIHVLFGLSPDAAMRTLNDYLWERCAIVEAAHDVTPASAAAGGGCVLLVPSSIDAGDIARVLREGYDAQMLISGLRALVDELSLDVLIVDTHPGVGEETLLSMVVSDTLVVVLRPDQQDYQGTAVTVELARKLLVPNMVLVVNKVPPAFDVESVQAQVEAAYECPVVAVLPHSDDLMVLASDGVFCDLNPNHPLTDQFRQAASALTG